MSRPVTSSAGGNSEEGFTLIELITVIVIIVILTLIAIPVYIIQREKGWDANVQSDLHNAVVSETTYYHDADTYTSQLSDLLDVGFKNSSKVTVTIQSANSEGFCIEAYHDANPGKVWYVDSGVGTPNPKVGNCP